MKIIVVWDLNCGPLCCFNLLLYITTTALVPTHNLCVVADSQIPFGMPRFGAGRRDPERKNATHRSSAGHDASVLGLLPMGRRLVPLYKVRVASLRKKVRKEFRRTLNRMQNFPG